MEAKIIRHFNPDIMRVLLVQPVIVIDQTNPKKYIFTPGDELPLNVLCLATFLREKGYDARVLDLRAVSNPWTSLRDSINEFCPRIVGITACSCEEIGASQVASHVKALDPSILTVFGGIQASAEPIAMMSKYPQFDLLAVGEGEFTLLEIIEQVEAQRTPEAISGTVSRVNGDLKLNPPRPMADSIDVFPIPDRSLIDIHRYFPNPITYNYKTLPTTGIIASRGCPYKCMHCSKGVWGNTVRFRSARSVFEEIVSCIELFGIRDFRFYDDVMTLHEGPLDELCQLLIDSRIEINFNCYSRIDQISRERLKLMKLAGCYHIKYGVESSSDRAIALSNRNTTHEHARKAIAMTKDVGILVKATFMMGMPGETESDFNRTIAFARSLEPDLASFGLFTLFPGSNFYKRIVQENDTDLKSSILEPNTVLPYISSGYRQFYFRASFILQRVQFLIHHPDFIASETMRFLRGSATLIWFFIRRSFRNA